MKPIFEAKYLAIQWQNSESIKSINESIFPIEINIIDRNNYFVEVQTYTRIENGSGQIAFHIYDEFSQIEPNVINASGDYIPLLKIEDPNTKKIWWIEDGKWNGKYRQSQLWNHAGNAKIQFGIIICDINIRTISFSIEEMNLYLNDFKSDFFSLIYKSDSFVSGNAKKKEIKILNKKTLILLTQFIDFLNRILENPKKELKEIQALKDRKEVRPVPKTYMEIATKGINKKLTSRDYTEFYDVVENRYICYMTNKVYSMVLQILNVLAHEQKSIETNQSRQRNRLDSFSKIKIINKKVFENDLNKLEKMIKEDSVKLTKVCEKQNDTDLQKIKIQVNQIEQFLRHVKEALSNQPEINISLSVVKTLKIKVVKRQADYGNKIQLKVVVNDFNDEKNIVIVSFNKQFFNEIFKEGNYYSVSGIIDESKYPTKYGNTIHNMYFVSVIDIKLEDYSPLQYVHCVVTLRKPSIYQEYINFYGSVINSNEKRFEGNGNGFYSFKFDKEIFSETLRDYYTCEIEGYVYIENKTSPNGQGEIYERMFKYIEDIKIIDSSLKKKLAKGKELFLALERSDWKMDMSYQELRQQDFEKDTINQYLDSLMQKNSEINQNKEELGVRLNQLKKITGKFKALKVKKDHVFPNSMTFIQNPNYQGSKKIFTRFLDMKGIKEDMFKTLLLIDQIGLVDVPAIYEKWCLLQIIKVLIEEYHFIPENNWKQCLINQVLTIRKNVKINFSSDTIGLNITLWYEKELESKKRPDFMLEIKSLKTGVTKRFIMDAKFREGINNILDLINSLYYIKDYSEGGKNMVFILHPDINNRIDNPYNPQSWAGQSYYGETELRDDDRPNHKYGAILLSPFDKTIINSHGGLDNLKRLIAMFLQYGMEENDNLKLNDENMTDSNKKEESFCTLCGSGDLSIKKFTTRSGMGYGHTVVCRNCNHHMEYNYCSGCQNRIIKNGRYWSYHATKPVEQFNIRCPACGDFRLEKSK